MGLLMFGYKEPGEEKKAKEVIKNDPTAASRSAIRRPNPPVRRRQHHGDERNSGRASPRSVRLSLGNYVVDDRDGEIVIAPRTQATQGANASDQGRAHPTYRAEVEDYLRLRDNSRVASWNRDATSNSSRDHAQPARRASERRTSQLRNEISHLAEELAINRRIRDRAAAIPSSDQDWLDRNLRYYEYEGPLQRANTGAADDVASPEVAGYRFTRPSENGMPSWSRSEDRRSRSPTHRTRDHVPDAASNSAANPGFPPLERQSARGSPVELRASTPRHDINGADGLGDRRRSVSPEGDAWETIMTTITQDENLPSAESSFTSATASASFSSRMDSQPTTSATSPSLANAVGDGDLPERDCDDDGAGLHTPNSLPDLVESEHGTASRGLARENRVPSMNLDGGGDSPEHSLSFEEARRELEREIETYTRSRTQQLLGSFLNRGEGVPESLWQAFVPRSLLTGAAVSGADSVERTDTL